MLLSVSAVRQPDGKIVVVGTAYGRGGVYSVRYNPDGNLDPTFGNDGHCYDLSNVLATFKEPCFSVDGKIVAVDQCFHWLASCRMVSSTQRLVTTEWLPLLLA